MIRIAISIVLAVLRIAGIHTAAYQAAAHLFVGALIGAFVIQWDRDGWGGYHQRLNLWLTVALSVVEVACFVWFRFFAGDP